MRHELTFILVFVAVVFVPTVNAQVTKQIDSTHQSNIQLYHTNHGVTGHNIEDRVPGTLWPRGSNNCFLFGSGIWVGAVVEQFGDLDTLVFVTYNPNSGGSWATPTSNLVVETTDSTEVFRCTFSDQHVESYEGGGDRRRSEGFPLGLKFDQYLVAWTRGPYSNSYAVSTTLTNDNTTRLLRSLVMGWVVDIDIGTLDSLKHIGKNDAIRIINTGNTPIVTSADSVRTEFGTIGISFVDSPASGISTCSIWPITIEFQGPDRYEHLTRGKLESKPNQSEILLVLGHKPIDLYPGKSINVSALFMFSEKTLHDVDEEMINLVNHWKSILPEEEDNDQWDVTVYPNPVNSSNVLHVSSTQTLVSSNLYNSLGILVATAEADPTSINVANLASGYYALLLESEGTMQTVRVIVIR